LIFVDTTVWVGDADLNDEFHASSHRVIEAIKVGELPPALTTDFVIDEVITILGKREGFGADNARVVGESILASPRVFVLFVDEVLLKEALKAYPDFKGRLSFTDTVSVVAMRKYRVKEIFSHDKDFDEVEDLVRKELP
jgi:predicted nucleic acid-binding protein